MSIRERSSDDFRYVEKFLERWQEQHGLKNVMETRNILERDDGEEKLYALKLRRKALQRLENDLKDEVELYPQNSPVFSVFNLLISQVTQKIMVVDCAIELSLDVLVQRRISELLGIENISGKNLSELLGIENISGKNLMGADGYTCD